MTRIKLLLSLMFISTFLFAQYNPGALDFEFPSANFETGVDYSGLDSNGNGYLNYNEIILDSLAPSGENFHLYEELTKGKPILLDFYTPSCAWCRTWTPIIDSLWREHGPDGDYQLDIVGVCDYHDGYYPGYAGIYYFWESVVYNDFHPLMTSFPENLQIPDVTGASGVFEREPYNITGHPTYLIVCPDRTWRFVEDWDVEHNGQSYTGGEESLSDSIMAVAAGCDPLATELNDVLVYDYIEPIGLICDQNITPKIKIQSRGTSELTSVDIVESVNGNDVTTYHWTGSLNQYDIKLVTLNQITLDPGDNIISFRIENPNGTTDENTANDILTKSLTVPDYPTHVNVIFDFAYVGNNEMAWKIEDHITHELLFEKSFSNPYTNTIDNQTVCLYDNKCYDFIFISNSGYGINATPPEESLIVKDENGVELIHLDKNNAEGSGGGQFVLTNTFCVGTVGIKNTKKSEISVFPNPGKGNINIDFGNLNESMNIKIVDVLGKEVLSIENINKDNKTYNLNIEDLNKGTYTLIIFNNNFNESIKYIKF